MVRTEDDLEDYYDELEEEALRQEAKRDRKAVIKMVVDGAGLKTVSINRRYRRDRENTD